MPNFYHALKDKKITSENNNKLQDVTIFPTLVPPENTVIKQTEGSLRLQTYNAFSNHDVYTARSDIFMTLHSKLLYIYIKL